MKAIARLRMLGLAALVWASALGASAQQPVAAAVSAPAGAFTAAQLEQMAAPIALYPDSLVTQILMASTYPLEVVEAARWVKANPSLQGKDLEEALKNQDWDVTVKALCGIPEVLARMNENLDWTRDLGDAFLAQKSELLDAVQRMRGKAYEAGNLATSEQQVVTQQPDKIIVIEQADPQVVYVPTYSSVVVYGGWGYPYYYYPAMYVAPPYGYGMMAFSAGVFWGAALSGGCNWGWGGSDVDIDIDRYNEFNRNTDRNPERTNIQDKRGDKSGERAENKAGEKAGNRGQWNHDAEHRGGVNYRDEKTAQQFGGNGDSKRVTRDQARGYDRAGANTRGAGQHGPSATNRASGDAGSRPEGGTTARGASATQRGAGGGATSDQRAASPRSPSGASRGGESASKGTAWSGSRSPSFDRSASSRGGASRSGSYSGGGGRGGGYGGGRGGGGGRRR